MKIGILGVGHLAGYLVPGLTREAGFEVLLSPRNADKAQALAQKHGVAVAPDSETLVAESEVVLLAVRPAQAPAAVEGLAWREGQTLVSLCAGVPLAKLAGAAPAALARAMPITAASIGESPTGLWPDLPAARRVLAPLGPVLALPDEAGFEAATVSAACYGWLHALIGEMTDWQKQAGLPPETARALVAQTAKAAAAMVQAPARAFHRGADPGSLHARRGHRVRPRAPRGERCLRALAGRLQRRAAPAGGGGAELSSGLRPAP